MKLIQSLRSFVGRGSKEHAGGARVLLGIGNEQIEVDYRVGQVLEGVLADRDRLCEEVRALRFQLGEAYSRLCTVEAAGQTWQI